MNRLLYAVMYTVNADFSGASYFDGKVMLAGLTEDEIAESPRVKNRIDHLGFNSDNDPEQDGLSTTDLSVMMSGLAAQDPNEVMGVLSKSQGRWLKYNHPDFMDKTTEDL